MASVTRYSISKPEKYTGRDGQQKTFWHNVGTMTEFLRDDGSMSRIIDIPAIGLKANVFEQKDDRQSKVKSQPAARSTPAEPVVNYDTPASNDPIADGF